MGRKENKINIQESLKLEDEKVLRALAENMTMSPSNDVLDTLYWLREHYFLVGLARTVEWFAKCAILCEIDPFVHHLDWKVGVVTTRKEKRNA